MTFDVTGVGSGDLLYVDAPIRHGCHAATLCRSCTKILVVGCGKYARRYVHNGYLITEKCDEYVFAIDV